MTPSSLSESESNPHAAAFSELSSLSESSESLRLPAIVGAGAESEAESESLLMTVPPPAMLHLLATP